MIWGDKTLAYFDIWSIEHLVSGITLGSLIIFIYDKLSIKEKDANYKWLYYISVIFVAYLWESLEHYLETGLINETVTFWFQGVEFWGNRLITDPLLLILGSFLYLRYNQLVKFARLFSGAWLISHIFIFPHSMYLQEQLLQFLSS